MLYTLTNKSVSEIQDIEIYLFENYVAGVDFTTTTERGDDVINSITVINQSIFEDEELLNLIS